MWTKMSYILHNSTSWTTYKSVIIMLMIIITYLSFLCPNKENYHFQCYPWHKQYQGVSTLVCQQMPNNKCIVKWSGLTYRSTSFIVRSLWTNFKKRCCSTRSSWASLRSNIIDICYSRIHLTTVLFIKWHSPYSVSSCTTCLR